MKTFITLIVLVLSFNAYALRCGNSLIDEGDSLYKVKNTCKIVEEYRVQNENADILKLYIKENGTTKELEFVDGELQGVTSSRF